MKKIELTEEQINDIAQGLDLGMNVYLNKETHEIKKIVDFENNIYADEEDWEDDVKEIENNSDKYIRFEKMSSSETYQVMQDFTETVKDKQLSHNLELGLSLSSPFRNFMDIIDKASDYREKWFEFKNRISIDFVEKQLEHYNNEL